MQKYAIEVEQMAPQGQAAVQAAERLGARTLVYRDKLPVAAIIAHKELDQLRPMGANVEEDLLLALCGTCQQDGFADALVGELTRTVMFKRGTR